MHVVVFPFPYNIPVHYQTESQQFTTYLETDSHDDVGLTLLWLVRFYTGVDELHQLIEDCLPAAC